MRSVIWRLLGVVLIGERHSSMWASGMVSSNGVHTVVCKSSLSLNVLTADTEKRACGDRLELKLKRNLITC